MFRAGHEGPLDIRADGGPTALDCVADHRVEPLWFDCQSQQRHRGVPGLAHRKHEVLRSNVLVLATRRFVVRLGNQLNHVDTERQVRRIPRLGALFVQKAFPAIVCSCRLRRRVKKSNDSNRCECEAYAIRQREAAPA